MLAVCDSLKKKMEFQGHILNIKFSRLMNLKRKGILNIEDVTLVCPHQAVGMDAVAKGLHTCFQKRQKPLLIGVGEKNLLAGVAAGDYMIEGAGILDAQGTCPVRPLGLMGAGHGRFPLFRGKLSINQRPDK